MVLSSKLSRRLRWWGIFLTCLLPLFILLYRGVNQDLGADPAKEIVLETGVWALNFLWLSLAITPIRKVSGIRWPVAFRRMIGLYSFFYGVLHLISFATFIVGWRIDLLLKEITERPYAIVGFIAILLMLPLAITSTKAMQKRLKKRWFTLHKLVYIVSVLALLHIVWQIRSDFSEALFYGVVLLFMLGYRVYRRLA